MGAENGPRAAKAGARSGAAKVISEAANPIGGEDLLHQPRSPNTIPPAAAPILDKALDAEREFGEKFDKWLDQSRKD